MRSHRLWLAGGLLVGVLGCGSGMEGSRLLGEAERGAVHRPVTTTSSSAQAWFDQGLVLLYGFDHAEAIHAFQRAEALDPQCAMAAWGIAYAHGPNINWPFMDEAQSRAAWEALERARARVGAGTAVEKALVAALEKRYAWPAPADRRPLDVAYAAAMREVLRRFPDDADVAALCAESLMDLRPWDLWSATGEPREETPEILSVLETALARTPDHPGLCHFYIHSVEASKDPGRALPAADRLRRRVPGSGHLVHMPSHIDIRLGRYPEAIVANQLGIAADRDRVQRAGAGGLYVVYRAHNYHFLVYAAMFDGQRQLAVDRAREWVRIAPMETVRQYRDILDTFLAMPYHVYVRFGLWDEMLREAAPPADLPVTTAVWRYGRGIALAASGQVDVATVEQDSFRAALGRVPESAYVGNNPARTVLGIAASMLDAEIEYRRGNFDRAFALLETAVADDDSLRYDEPWGWMQPVRHALGALLLEQGRIEPAEQVYRKDLELHPGNGWALHGLAECLRRSGRGADAAEVDARFKSAWTRSDTPIHASCYCRRKA